MKTSIVGQKATFKGKTVTITGMIRWGKYLKTQLYWIRDEMGKERKVKAKDVKILRS